MAESAPALKVEDIHKSFGNIKVLKGISLEAFDHDVISILGSSGSGKSTLLRCINLLETPKDLALAHLTVEHPTSAILLWNRAITQSVPSFLRAYYKKNVGTD